MGVEGDVRDPGIYLFEGPEMTVGSVMEAMVRMQGEFAQEVLADTAAMRIRTGQMVRISVSKQGSVAVELETMPAAA